MKTSFLLLVILVSLIGESFAQCPSSSIDQTVKSCQCVVYVKRRLNYNDGTIHAKDWGSKLFCKGFTASNDPQNKDIAVFQPRYKGADATSGHVGLVSTANKTSDGKAYRITLVHTNWPGGTPSGTECGCTNVGYKEFIIPITDIGFGIAFYRKAGAIQSCK